MGVTAGLQGQVLLLGSFLIQDITPPLTVNSDPVYVEGWARLLVCMNTQGHTVSGGAKLQQSVDGVNWDYQTLHWGDSPFQSEVFGRYARLALFITEPCELRLSYWIRGAERDR